MNCFCGMVDRQKAFSLISSWDHCQRSSSSRISNMPQAGFEPTQNLSSGLFECSCAVVIIITPWRHSEGDKFSSIILGNTTGCQCRSYLLLEEISVNELS